MLVGSDLVAVGNIMISVYSIDEVFVDNFQGKEFWVSVRTHNKDYDLYRVSKVYETFQHAEFQRRIIHNQVSLKLCLEEKYEYFDMYGMPHPDI